MDAETMSITSKVDLVYSPDDGGYYLQEYILDGSGATRTTTVYKDKERLLALFYSGAIHWSEWQ